MSAVRKGSSGLRILWIARTCPFPANDGEKLRVFNLLKALSTEHELTVVYRVMAADEIAGEEELRKFCRGGVHGVNIPRPKGILRKIGWVLPFVISRYPISLATVFFEPIAAVLQALSTSQRFDIVQVEHSSLAIYLDRVHFAGSPATVLTMHNIDHVRNERVLRNTPWGIKKLYHYLNQRRFKRWELGVLQQFDEVIAMSSVDREMLLGDLPTLPVEVVPNGVDASAIAYLPAPPEATNVIFVASMDSEANHDGAMFFLREVWPLVRGQHQGACLQFVGRNPMPELVAAHNGNDVFVTGKVDDVLCYYQDAAVAIVPLRSGGGTRLKILEAMAAGTAVVSTTVGCEGLEVKDGRNIVVADEPAVFAQGVLRMLADREARMGIAKGGRELVEATYDWALIARQHDVVYRQAVAAV